ncbi:MAG: DNA-primase RepB domain-containing protein [Terriglobia bacterium]
MNGAFRPDHWLAVLAVNRNSGEILQRVSTARSIASPEYQRWLRYLNATGSDVYVSLNTFKEHARGRTKEDSKEIRHLYLDLDDGGARKLEAIRQDKAVPTPNYVLNTSPGKFQVIWRVEGIDQEHAEAVLRTLAQRFGGDPAATDSTRVFRLPGFNNKKYPDDFQVTVIRESPAARTCARYSKIKPTAVSQTATTAALLDRRGQWQK